MSDVGRWESGSDAVGGGWKEATGFCLAVITEARLRVAEKSERGTGSEPSRVGRRRRGIGQRAWYHQTDSFLTDTHRSTVYNLHDTLFFKTSAT